MASIHLPAFGQFRGMGRVVEKQPDIVMQRALISLQSQHVIATLGDYLRGDGALAIERVGGHDRALEGDHLQQFWHRGDLVRLLLRRHLAGGRRGGGGRVFPSIAMTSRAASAKSSMKAQEARLELHRIEQSKHPAERIVAARRCGLWRSPALWKDRAGLMRPVLIGRERQSLRDMVVRYNAEGCECRLNTAPMLE